MSDLVVLWSVFVHVYERLGKEQLASIVRSDECLTSDIRQIIEGSSATGPDGSFWHFPTGLIPLEEAMGAEVIHVLKTLRNGFAHSHWLFQDLSAFDYWAALGWPTEPAPPEFHLHDRPAKNYMMYIADAPRWNPQNFWQLDDLRILVTPSATLRYFLQLFLHYLLNGSRKNVF